MRPTKHLKFGADFEEVFGEKFGNFVSNYVVLFRNFAKHLKMWGEFRRSFRRKVWKLCFKFCCFIPELRKAV